MLKKTKLVSLMLLAGTLAVPESAFAEITPERPSVSLSQQNGKVVCVVEDPFGPVIGASVVVKGTTNGNVTDMDGKVVLENLKKGDIIQISYIGYATQEITYTGQTVNPCNIKRRYPGATRSSSSRLRYTEKREFDRCCGSCCR
ncbi:MAG: carboxypeptidase-like regulatory domain-containing protein [Parabacteroides merdae]